jgi:hypothetical protein
MVSDFEKAYFEANDVEYTVVEEDATAKRAFIGGEGIK